MLAKFREAPPRQDEAEKQSNEKENFKSAAKRLIGRKGRKRLSAMVSKLTGSKTRRLKLELEAAANSRTGADEDDDDDDDEAYKSAVEDLSDCDADAKSGCRDKARRRVAFEKGAVAQTGPPAHSSRKQSTKSLDEPLPEEKCDIPTFLHTPNCDAKVIEETRRLLKERYLKNPDSFYDDDYKRMLEDDWTVSRFLLRRRCDPKRTAKLMEECGQFRRQYKMSEVQLWEFPIEFHKAGGLFRYAPDLVGNETLFMRVKMYRRIPEISDVFKAFILCAIELCDTANGGRGTAVIFDLDGCGLQNVDLGFLSWLLSSFRNYCPKGVSYIVVYNLPWFLSATAKLAMTWMSASNRRCLRFAYGDELQNFIAKENLPDFCGGTCKLNYRAVPPGSRPATEVCERLDITPEQALKIREQFKQYLDDADDDESSGPPKQASGASPNLSRHTDQSAASRKVDEAGRQGALAGDKCTTSGTASRQHTTTTTTPSDYDSRAAARQPVPPPPEAERTAKVVDLVSQASKFFAP